MPEPHHSPQSACAAAARHYRNSLGWKIVLSDDRHTVALSMPDRHAGVYITANLAGRVNQRLIAAGLAGPVIGWPDGHQVHLVTCQHPQGELPEPQLDPRVVHLGVGTLVYLPPTRYTDIAETPLVWIRGPTAHRDLPDCGRLFGLIHDIMM